MTAFWIGIFLVILATVVTVALSVGLRFKAPAGSFFVDSERAAGIFNSIGTLFSVVLALVIFLSVDTYTQTKSHAGAEADAVLEQFQLARLFPSDAQFVAQSQLLCYGRSVISEEWPLQRHGPSPVVDEWARAMDATTDSVKIRDQKQSSGFELFLQQTLDRQEERRGRLEGADGTLPPMVWPILLLGAVVVLVYVIAYADSAERLATQVLQVGLLTLLLGASLMLVRALDQPFSDNPGKIQPDKMEETVSILEDSLALAIDSNNIEATLPCDRNGIPKSKDPVAKTFPDGSTMEAIVQRGRIRIGVSHTIALFGELDPVSGVVSGFDADLGRQIAREMGLREDQIEWVPTLVEDRIPYLLDGRVDLVIEVMTITPARQVQVDFSRPYFIAGQSILVQDINRSISNIRDLENARVCLVPGSTSANTLMQLFRDIQLVYMSNFTACVGALERNEADAISTDDIILAGLAATNDNLVLVGGQFTTEPYGIAVAKGHEDFVEFINGVIDDMINDGRWGRLYYQYLGDIPGLAPVSEAKQRLLSYTRH